MLKENKGNVLFLILIAVALFAALSYAVTQSSKTGGDSIGKDKAKLIAAQIMQYASSIEQAIVRIMLINGCSDTTISFDNPFVGYNNASSPADKRCHVFDANGGGVSYQKIEPVWYKSTTPVAWTMREYMPANDSFVNVGVDCPNNTCTELSFQLWGLTDELCDALNKNLKIPTKYTETISGNTQFVGTYTYNATNVIGATEPNLAGVRAACITTGTHNVFYHVTLAR